MWSEQAAGVGHFAKYAEKRLGAADTDSLLIQLALEKKASEAPPRDRALIHDVAAKLADESPQAKRAYDQPSKGILWGWEVSAYVWTKAIASGTYLVAMLLWLGGLVGWLVFRPGRLLAVGRRCFSRLLSFCWLLPGVSLHRVLAIIRLGVLLVPVTTRCLAISRCGGRSLAG